MNTQIEKKLFQSSPTPKGGRYVEPFRCSPVASCFNPRPPRKVGATVTAQQLLDRVLVSILAHPERWALHAPNLKKSEGRRVSILAHPERWALRSANEDQRGEDYGFNPRPPRKVGATPDPAMLSSLQNVSILAHPERWALRQKRINYTTYQYRFNPRPPRKVGATKGSKA